MRKLLKKPVFDKRNSDWLSELISVIKQYKKTIHSSTKMTPIQTFKKNNEKEVYPIFKVEELNNNQNIN